MPHFVFKEFCAFRYSASLMNTCVNMLDRKKQASCAAMTTRIRFQFCWQWAWVHCLWWTPEQTYYRQTAPTAASTQPPGPPANYSTPVVQESSQRSEPKAFHSENMAYHLQKSNRITLLKTEYEVRYNNNTVPVDEALSLITSHECSAVRRSVTSVCVSACDALAFESLALESSFVVCGYIFTVWIMQVKIVYTGTGHRVKVKVTEAAKVCLCVASLCTLKQVKPSCR